MKGIWQQQFRRAGWLMPLAYSIAALAVGVVLPRLEYHYAPHLVSSVSSSSAMAICSSIASGMITLTGVVFSLVFVMVQFSATAYSPRLVLWVARDRVMAHALGMFCATFLYALALLAWVDRETSGRVPPVSTWTVVVLLLASMGMFIALVQRIGMLQVNRMLIFTGDQGRHAIEALYQPRREGGRFESKPRDHSLPVTQIITHVGRPQVIQGVRVTELLRLAQTQDALIEVAVPVGGTVVESSPLLKVCGACQPLPEPDLRRALQLGDERMFGQDPKFAVRLVVDIALKALSPAINDPTTAVQALDQIEDLLLRLGRSELDIGCRRDFEGRVRLLVPFPSWDDYLLLALDEIRACGANSVQVMRRMKALIKNLAGLLPAERRPALQHWEERLRESVSRSFPDAEEKREASVADREGLGAGQEPAAEAGLPAHVPLTLEPRNMETYG